MKKILTKRGRLITLIAFIILTIVAIFLSPLVNINYDMRKYLATDSNTRKALVVLDEEFGSNSMIQLMTDNLSIAEAPSIISKIEEIEVVKSVIWLGTVSDISVPVENMDQDLIKDYYKDGHLLFTIEFNEDDYSLKVGAAIEDITKIMDDHNIVASLRGPAIENKVSRDYVNNQFLIIIAIAVPLAIIILFLSSASWLEPVVILINLGITIAINLGTNFIFPSVSYITMSIASVLQLAMSLDYSLFIVHRYYEERDKGLDPVAAAYRSAKDAFGTVTASAATTVFGFLALVIMDYKIGFDIGISLVKAIVISYFTAIILLPVLLVYFDKVILKYRHKMLMPSFKKITEGLHKGRYVILILFIILGVASFYLQGKTTYKYGDSTVGDETSIGYIHREKINKKFGIFNPVVILYSHDDKDNALVLVDKLDDYKEVINIQSLMTSVDPQIPEEMIPKEALDQFKSEKYYRMIIYLNSNEETEDTYELSNRIVNLAHNTLDDECYVIGVPIATTEIKESVTKDGILVQIVSAIAIALVILLVLRNPVTPLVLVLVIEVAIFINVAITYLTGGTLAYIGYLVVSSLQLGATIDYAVLLASRYKEFRVSMTKKDAMIAAATRSTPAIITSSAVLAGAGFVVFFVSSLGIVKEIGMLIGRGAIISGLMVMFILPVLLLIFDPIIEKTKINIKLKKNRNKEEVTNEENI
ncbi:MAG: MMPL family transporter [Acholeplasmataceae bacterium]|jgi:predicted RND superfamily exporter protein|nr:MMPL family transporter [Acholeplasmataceae bacterium]